MYISMQIRGICFRNKDFCCDTDVVIVKIQCVFQFNQYGSTLRLCVVMITDALICQRLVDLWFINKSCNLYVPDRRPLNDNYFLRSMVLKYFLPRNDSLVQGKKYQKRNRANFLTLENIN